LVDDVLSLVKESFGVSSDRFYDQPMSFPTASLINILGLPILRNELGDDTENIDIEINEELKEIEVALHTLGYGSQGNSADDHLREVMVEASVSGIWNLIARPIRQRGEKVYIVKLRRSYSSIENNNPTVSVLPLKEFYELITNKLLMGNESINKLKGRVERYYVLTVILGVISAFFIVSLIVQLILQ